MVAQGHEVASHTVNHQDLSTLSESEIRWELDESQMSISQNVPNQDCASLAYPFTNSNSTVQAAAADYYVAARSGWVELQIVSSTITNRVQINMVPGM